MDLHANAVLTVRQRQRVCDLVAAGVTITAAALVVGCSRQTASKWVNRRRRGEACAIARAGRTAHRRRTPAVVEQAILRAREELREGPHVIGWALGIAASTVHAVLRRHGRSRLVVRAASRGGRPLRALAARRARARRHQEARPHPQAGPSRHRRSPRRAQGQGRLAVPVRRDRRPLPPRLRRRLPRRDGRQRDSPSSHELVRFYGSHGIAVERVLTDNGTCFKRRWADACAAHGDRRQEDPRLPPADQRQGRALHPHPARALGVRLPLRSTSQSVWPPSPPALDFYNRFRPHRALGGLTPLQRVNNLPGTYT